MSSKSGSASASKGGMSNKTAESSAVVQAKRAEEYAKKKLGITETVAGPIKGANTSVTGIYSTAVPNQMYGDKFREAQGEYLASQGLATARTIVDATGKEFTVYDKSKPLMDAVNRTRIPLSRQMYQSQQLFTQIAGAIGTAISGMPSFFSAAYYASKKPYSKYVGDYMEGAKKGVGNQTITSSKNQTTIDIRDTPKVANDFDAAARGDEKALKRVQALAKSGEGGSPNRKFLVSSAKTFLGKMKSGNLDADYSGF